MKRIVITLAAALFAGHADAAEYLEKTEMQKSRAFSPAVIEWLSMGGVYVDVNLRGGSEYGEAWHQAGMRAKKQNVFDDFIAAAENLIARKYTSTPKLAIFGGSNGGLLVGAVLNQRPDLYGAAMPAVGVMDMLRFQKFGFGTQWVGEYGSPDNAADYKVLRAYSPLHNIRKGTKYPATLVTTADHDDRVMPGHSLKYAATGDASFIRLAQSYGDDAIRLNPNIAYTHVVRGRIYAETGQDERAIREFDRALAVDGDEGPIWFWIGSHAEYDRIIRGA